MDVYKVVTKTKEPHVFRSYWNMNPICKTYILDEETKGDTPLFIFDDMEHAIRFTSDNDPRTVAILVGTTTRLYLPPRYILAVSYLDDKDRLQQFWRDAYRLNSHVMEERYKSVISIPPHGTYFCYDFTPTRVVEIQHAY